MYDAQKIIEFKKRVQKRIAELIDEEEKELVRIVKSEIKPTDSVILAMGTCVIENKDGEDLDNDFVDELTGLNYNDAFETGMSISLYRSKKQATS